jgi:hypothetical protein
MPALSISVDAEKIFQAFLRIPLIAARELRVELINVCDVVRRDAATNHRFKSGTGKSGRAEEAPFVQVSYSGLEGRVILDKKIMHATYLHEGTGKYGKGHGEYRIQAKNKKTLHWVSGGKEYFVKKGLYITHPGIKPDPFLYRAFNRQKPFIIARMKAAVSRVFQMAGLK